MPPVKTFFLPVSLLTMFYLSDAFRSPLYSSRAASQTCVTLCHLLALQKRPCRSRHGSANCLLVLASASHH